MVSSIGNGAMDLISGKPFNEVVGNTLIGLATAPIAQGVSNAAGEILDPVPRKIRGPLIKYVIDNVVRNVVGAQVATTGVGVMSGKSWGEAFESSIPATITAAVTGVAQGVVSAHFEAKARDNNMITGADNKKTISLEKIETVQVNTDVSTPVSGELVNPIEDPQLTHTWGTDRVANDGTGTPNSIYSYTIKDLNKVKNNYIYNSDGKVSFQVDFELHGTENPSGHGHQMVPPGNLGSGHNGNHVPLENVPPAYHIMPPGYQPKYPIGTTHK